MVVVVAVVVVAVVASPGKMKASAPGSGLTGTHSSRATSCIAGVSLRKDKHEITEHRNRADGSMGL